MKFSIKDFSSGEILHGKLHFLWNVIPKQKATVKVTSKWHERFGSIFFLVKYWLSTTPFQEQLFWRTSAKDCFWYFKCKKPYSGNRDTKTLFLPVIRLWMVSDEWRQIIKTWIIDTAWKVSNQIRCFFWFAFSVFDWIRRDTPYLSVFSPNAGKYGPEKTPYLDTFHAVKAC